MCVFGNAGWTEMNEKIGFILLTCGLLVTGCWLVHLFACIVDPGSGRS